MLKINTYEVMDILNRTFSISIVEWKETREKIKYREQMNRKKKINKTESI